MLPPIKRLIARLGLVLFALGVAVAVWLLGDSGVHGDMRIITPHWEGVRIEFARGFNQWRVARGEKPVLIEWLDVGGTSDILRYLRSMFSGKKNGEIDIAFGGGLDPYLVLMKEGIFAPCPLPAAIMTNIPPTLHGVPLYDTNSLWYGAALSGFGILYNNVVIGKFSLPTPTTWEDLAKPGLRGWVGAADLRKSGSVHMMYEIVLQAYGWEKGMEVISALSGNVRTYAQSASTVPKDIAMGDIATGMCIDMYAWSTVARVGGGRLGFSMPPGLTVVNPDAIALLRDAPHDALAREFIEFVMSEDGQKLWMLRKNSMPGAPIEYDLTKMPVWPSLFAKYAKYAVFPDSPFDWKDTIHYDSAKGSARFNIVNDYIGCLFIDARKECVKAWNTVCMLPEYDPRRQQYFHHPLDEKALMALAEGDYTNPVMRAKLTAQWATDARRRYAAVVEEKK